jgi:MoaD family protein
MRIDLEIAFSFKRELGEAHPSLELPEGADVEAAVRALVRRYPEVASRLFDEDGSILRHINALINGGNVTRRRGFRTALADGDRLTILPPAGGG